MIYNSYIIKLTCWKYTIQLYLPYSELCRHHRSAILEGFPYPMNPALTACHSHTSQLPQPHATPVCFLLESPCMKSYNMWPFVFGCCCLAYFFEIHPCSCTYQLFIPKLLNKTPFYRYTTFCSPIYHLVDIWLLSPFWLLWTMLLCLCVQFFVWTYVFSLCRFLLNWCFALRFHGEEAARVANT